MHDGLVVPDLDHDPIQSILDSLEADLPSPTSFAIAAGVSSEDSPSSSSTTAPTLSPTSPQSSELTFDYSIQTTASSLNSPNTSSLPLLDVVPIASEQPSTTTSSSSSSAGASKSALTHTVSLPTSVQEIPRAPPRSKRDKNKKGKSKSLKETLQSTSTSNVLVVSYRKSDDSLSTISTTGATGESVESEDDAGGGSESRSLTSDLELPKSDDQHMSPIEEVQEAIFLNEELSKVPENVCSTESVQSEDPIILEVEHQPAPAPTKLLVPFNGSDRFRRAKHKFIDLRGDDPLTVESYGTLGKLFSECPSLSISSFLSLSV